MAIAKERYVTSLMCLKAVTPALVQASTFGIMFTAFVVSQIDFQCCCAVPRGGAERCASCEARAARDETALSLHMSWLQSF